MSEDIKKLLFLFSFVFILYGIIPMFIDGKNREKYKKDKKEIFRHLGYAFLIALFFTVIITLLSIGACFLSGEPLRLCAW